MPGAKTIPAPTGGWNARDALESMPPTDAVKLINWIPSNGVVTGRGGSHTVLSGLGFPVNTLIPYEGDTSTKLLAAYGNSIADITGFTTPTVLGTGFGTSLWQYGAFDNKLVLVNGTSNPQVYDGTALTAMVATQLTTPVNATFTPGAGTLTTATYYYRVSAINLIGETLASTETSLAVTGPAGVNVNWTAVTGATGYKVYGNTTGAEQLIATVGNVLTYLDDGSVTPAGVLPVANTTAPQITRFLGVTNFKGRAFYWDATSQNAWYCDANSFQGTFHKLPLANFTQRGGYISQIITWTRDSGDGVDDYLVFYFSTGEMLVYQGDNPSIATQFSMIGRFYAGAPLGVRAHSRFASTEILLTSDGFIGLDEAITNARSEIVNTFGGKIERAASDAAQQFPSNRYWNCLYYPRGNLFIVNVPISTTDATQYVKNTNTGSWCQFQGWPAKSMCLYLDRLYFGTSDGKVKLADVQASDGYNTAYSDDGIAITYEGLTAYQRFGQPGLQTQLTATKLVTNAGDPRALSINAFADFKAKVLPAIADPVEFVEGQWDVSFWDTDYWAGPTSVDPTDMTPHISVRPVNSFGFATALNVRYKSVVQNVSWFSTTFIYKQAGVI